ncbi:hypothetical protein IT774_08560 [Salinimonas marina]|uniref:Uncharacterized protein n=1 Tax=Salinimonas marina TaxID=2785918 RepID=A0A7S9DUT7_9ALTE|nr:hypothetical protein [Salinimonas marina]QPG04332.1 hypothetical protein IT774_08560 [Salinimonas marina]
MLNPTILGLANALNAFHPRSPVSYLQVAHYCRNVSLDILKKMTHEVESSSGHKGLSPEVIVEQVTPVDFQESYLLAEVRGVPRMMGRHFVSMPIDERCKGRLMAMSQGCARNDVLMICDIAPHARYIALPYGVSPAKVTVEDLDQFDHGVSDIVVRVERATVTFSKLYDVGGAPTEFLTQSTLLEDIYENNGMLVSASVLS